MRCRNKHSIQPACLVGLIGLVTIIGSCSWTPKIETVLYDGPQGIVTLRTLSDSLGTDHPVKIKNSTMERVLRGAHKFRDVRLMENLVGGDAKPVRLFSQSEIAFLAPQLTSALAQSTPEEEVVFQCTAELEGAPPIKGRLLVHDSTLFFTWTEPLSKPKVLAKQRRETGGLPDPSMPQEHTLVFLPELAVRPDGDSTEIYLKRLGENTVAIDYPLLASLPETAFTSSEVEYEDSESAAKEDSSQDGPPSVSSHPGSSSEGTGVSSQSETLSQADSDIRELREQMEELQKKMTEQEEELERLKKEKP